MIYVMLPPQWLRDTDPESIKPVQCECTLDEALKFNEQGYNVYYYPNFPSNPGKSWVKAHEVDTFHWVFVDMDLKSKDYESKEEFLEKLFEDERLTPTKVVDSGGGVHAYWRVTDLNGENFLKLSRRLARKLKTDLAVQQLKQLMRAPDTVNTKNPDDFKLCELIYEGEDTYTCEQLDSLLPPLTLEDATYCKEHYEKSHNIKSEITVDEKLPLRFGRLLRTSSEAKDIWAGNVDDRSKGDYRLGHIMFAAGFTRDEALSVLVNSSKALSRAPVHRVGYATNIVDKIWNFEEAKGKIEAEAGLSSSVLDILARHGDALDGTRFPCWKYLDDTEKGFRLGQVIGLVGGSGVGKTEITLNMFMGFVESNPDYEHIFVSLEQPENEIASRWRKLCGGNIRLHRKVHIIGNYNQDGSYRNLCLDDIREYLLKFQKERNVKIGCVVVDHIGALKRTGKDGRASIEDICHEMKAFAIETGTLMVMQSQAPREKAGIGDLELNKDAAYGTVFFESYCDYLITIWQPLKRAYSEEGCPTVTAFKFCKIRHKNQLVDVIKEDLPYRAYFEPMTGRLRELTEEEEVSFDFFNKQCTNRRKKDRKTDLVTYTSIKWDDDKGEPAA